MPGPFDNSFRPTPNFGQGAPGMDAQSPASFSPDLAGAPQPGNFMDDPQLQAALQQVLDSNPQLADDIQKDPELQSHIMNVIAQGPGAMKGAGPNGIMPQGMDVGAVGGMPPGMQPQAPTVPQQSQSFANLYGATPGPEKTGRAGFGQYVNSQAGRDDMMMGLIMSNYGTNPEKALEMAIRFKQIKDQRTYQAEQNKQQREATAANVKMRTDADKLEKVDNAWRQDSAKGEASLRMAGVSPDEILAKIGPWTKENSEQWKTEVTNAVAKKKADDAREKEEQVDFKNRQGIARDTFSSGSVLSSKYTQPTLKDGKPNPKYDAAFAKGLEELATTRKDIRTVHMANQKAHQKLMERRYQLETGKMSDQQKAGMKLKFDQLEDIYKRVMEAKKQIDAYKPYSEGDNIFGEAYQAFVADYNEAMEEYKTKASEIKGASTSDMGGVTTPGESEVAAPPAPSPNTEQAPPAQDPAMAQRVRGLQRLVNEAQQKGQDPQPIIDRFKAKFPGVLAE